MIEQITLVAKKSGVLVNDKLISLSKFSKMVDPHPFSNYCYQVYLGSGAAGELIKYKPYLNTRSKASAIKMFYQDLVEIFVKDNLEPIEDGDVSFCQKYSIMW